MQDSRMYEVTYYRFMLATLKWQRFTIEISTEELIDWMLRHSENDCVRLHSVKEIIFVNKEVD